MKLQNQEASHDITHITDDIIQIYHLKKRLTHEWLPVIDLMEQSDFVQNFTGQLIYRKR